MNGNRRVSLFRLLRPTGRQWGWLILAVALACLTLAAGMGLLALSGWFITAAALAGLGWLVLDIFTPGAGIRALAITRTVTRYAERLVAHEATFRQLATLRVRLFGRLLALEPDALHRLRRSEALDRLTHDIDLLDRIFLQLASPTLAVVSLTLITAGLLHLAAPGTAWPLAGLLASGAILLALGTRAVRQPGRALAAATPRLRTRVAETLTGRTELRLLGRLEPATRAIRDASRARINAQVRLRWLETAGRTALHLLGLVTTWTVLTAGLVLYSRGVLEAPQLALSVLATLAVADAWPPLATGWTWLETCRRAAGRVQALTADTGSKQTAGNKYPAPPDARLPLILTDVTFAYGPDQPPILERINLCLEPGERLVVTGPSGSGKTTLARILAGLTPPGNGRVMLGEHTLQSLDPRWLRGHIGYMPQQPMLFTDTLAANLRLAASRAEDDVLYGVLEQLQLADFLQRLPDGLETWIGEAGFNVSGGEARRLALARLILGDFPVLILDEPAAGLDAATSRRIAENLRPWLTQRTLVMVTHDPEAWPVAERRKVLEHGRLRDA